MSILSEESQELVTEVKVRQEKADPDATEVLMATIDLLGFYAYFLENEVSGAGRKTEEASREISVGVLKIVFTLTDNRLGCRVYVLGVFVEEYFIERNGPRIFAKYPANGGYADIEFWWEGQNLHAKARLCTKPVIGGIVCTRWVEGNVAIPGA